jgi:hypothetical protein
LAPGDVGPIRHHELISGPAVEEDARITQHTGKVLKYLVVGAHVGVAAVSVSGIIERKNHLSHRPPFMMLYKKSKHRPSECPITKHGGAA